MNDAPYLAGRAVYPGSCQRCDGPGPLALVVRTQLLAAAPHNPDGRRYWCEQCVEGCGPTIRRLPPPDRIMLPPLQAGVEAF